jgi:hypothetical protein
MLWLLEQYYIKHRDHSFSRAVGDLVTDLYPKRRTHMPQSTRDCPRIHPKCQAAWL